MINVRELVDQDHCDFSFKRMLDAHPKKICMNAVNAILQSYRDYGINTNKMEELVNIKLSKAQSYILPIN